MIPPFNERGELPPGIHVTTVREIEDVLGFNSRRRRMVGTLRRALRNLQEAGVQAVYIDGSFTSQKPLPNDIDGCGDADEGVDAQTLDPVFLDFNDSETGDEAQVWR